MAPSPWLSFALGVLVAGLFTELDSHAQTAASTVSASASASASASSATSRNVYLAGASVRPAGPVAGDMAAAGGRVVADQPIQGDALLIGGSVDARADIGDDLRAFGGDVSIEGTIGGELLAAGGNVVLLHSARVGQGAALAGGLVTIDGKVDGRLMASARRIVLNGEVNGDAHFIAERIELGPKSRISGALRHTSRELQRADGAVVGGALTREEHVDAEVRERGQRPYGDRDDRSDARWEYRWQTEFRSWVGLVLGFLGLLATGTVLLLLFPKFMNEAPQRIRESPWLALGIGFGALVGLPVLAALLMVTVLGIPLGVAAMALYPVLLLVGYLSGALFIASITHRGPRRRESASLLVNVGLLAVALSILMLLAIFPIVGPFTVFLTTVAGIGACILEWHRRRPQSPSDAVT